MENGERSQTSDALDERRFDFGFDRASTRRIGFGADEPAAPATPQPPRTAAAPHPRAVVTDQDGEPLEPLKPLKTETAQDKTRKEALAWFMSGRLKQSESRFSEALSDYQMAIKLDPNAVEVYRALVPLAFALSETEKGLQYAQKAIELDPQDLDILRMLAEQLHEQQQLGKAAEYLSRAANSPKLKKDTPTYVLLQLQLAALYMEMTRQDKGTPSSPCSTRRPTRTSSCSTRGVIRPSTTSTSRRGPRWSGNPWRATSSWATC